MKLLKQIIILLLFTTTNLAYAKWSDWSEMTWLTGDIYWQLKSEKSSSGGCEYRIRFKNRGNVRVELSYGIVNGHGSDSVKMDPGERKTTVSNFTKHPCSQGIELDYKIK